MLNKVIALEININRSILNTVHKMNRSIHFIYSIFAFKTLPIKSRKKGNICTIFKK